MVNIDIEVLELRIGKILPMLSEYQRRRYLSTEAKAIGGGGISVVSRISGVSRQTLTEGVKELDDPEKALPERGRSRKPGGVGKPYGKSGPRYWTSSGICWRGIPKGIP